MLVFDVFAAEPVVETFENRPVLPCMDVGSASAGKGLLEGNILHGDSSIKVLEGL